MKTIVKILILVLLLAIGKLAKAQCTNHDVIAVSTIGFKADAGYLQEYVAVDANGIIVEINSTGTFSTLIGGSYTIYAVNYSIAPAVLAVGNQWSSVASFAGANCFDYISQSTCVDETLCQPNDIVATTNSFEASAGYSQTYVLVNSSGTILASNTTGTFTTSDYLADGDFSVYAVNTESAAVITEIADNGPFSDITALASTECVDILGPRLFGVGYNCPLPIDFLTFNGKNEKTHNFLKWDINNKEDALRFELQRSADGESFATIHKSLNLEYKDEEPFQTSYYRVLILEKDGSKVKSKTIKIERNNDFNIINVFPNPAQNLITISLQTSEENVIIEIQNTLGQQLFFERINTNSGLNQLEINTSNLPNGVYYLSVSGLENREVQKIVVKR